MLQIFAIVNIYLLLLFYLLLFRSTRDFTYLVGCALMWKQGYIVLNRPWAFVQWLEKATIEEEYVLLLDRRNSLFSL